jgi:glycosyltransferase involved in cell wall biosynthesis
MTDGPAVRRRSLVLRVVGDERGASTRYRVLAHRPALEAAGYRTSVRFTPPGGRAARAFVLARDLVGHAADLFFVHRRTYPGALARGLRRVARRLVFDMDDALDLPPPSAQPSERELRRYRERFEATVHAFDLVLCGNRELAARLPHDRFELLPTPVDTVRFSPNRIAAPQGKALGWVGHSDNLSYLESLADPLRELARRHPGLRLIVVADRPARLPGLDVEFRRWSLATEVSCFDGIGVGLMPLDDTPWARSKCAFKALQYLALGIPAVVSPVGMNREVVTDGETGFLAADDRDWIEALDRLLSDPDLARAAGARGRQLVEKRYSLGTVSGRLVDILDSVVSSPSSSSAQSRA